MKTTSSLRQLCLAGGSQAVAVRAGQRYYRDDMRHFALQLAAALRQRPEHTWALWLNSPYEFLCSFLALALAGKRIVLPANMQAHTAATLAAHFDAALTEVVVPDLARPCLAPKQLIQSLDKSATDTGVFSGDSASDADVEIVLFTSGSTGQPQAIVKTLALLEAELTLLQQQWGATLSQLPVLATVSHQHIYGLLHALLWPVLRGALFIDEICQYPEAMMALAQQQAPVVLISSPTHLKRLPEVDDFCRQPHLIAHIVSSGGLLDAQAARALAGLGHTPLEVLGSTETGGVAWRQQERDPAWQALPGVDIQVDESSGCLAVRSAHLGAVANASGWYVMGDRVELLPDLLSSDRLPDPLADLSAPEQRFVLQGRADTLVKVEGKRVSVSEMEAHLHAHIWVNQVRIAVVRARREEVGAVIELSSEGQQALAQQGKLALNQQLRDYLLAFFERPVLPRRWRYVATLPMNSQGKVVLGDVQALLLQKEA